MGRFLAAAVLVITCVAGAAGYWYHRSSQVRPLFEAPTTSTDWLEGLDHSNPQANEQAANEVRQLGARAVPDIRKVLQDPAAEPRRKKAALRACALLGVHGLPVLQDVVAHLAQPEYTSEAALALSMMGSDAYAPLSSALASENAEVRREAARALGKLRDRAQLDASFVVPALLELLADPDADVRQVATTYLGIIHEYPDAAVPALVEMLNDEDPEVRTSAATALGEFGAAAEPALPALRKAQGDKDENVAREAGVSIVKLQSQKLADGR